MTRSMVAAVALGFGLVTSIAGEQTASALPGAPAVAAADTTAVQANSVTKVFFRGFRGWHGGWRPGYGWRSGYGWVPLAAAGAVVAGAAAGAYYYGPRPYYYGPGPYYYGPRPYYYGPGPYYGPRY